jgi:hypothetical protein
MGSWQLVKTKTKTGRRAPSLSQRNRENKIVDFFQRTGLKSNPTSSPIPSVTPADHTRSQPLPQSYTLNPHLNKSGYEESAGHGREGKRVQRSEGKSGVSRKEVSKKEARKRPPGPTGDGGGHSALPNVYGLKASSLFCRRFLFFVLRLHFDGLHVSSFVFFFGDEKKSERRME